MKNILKLILIVFFISSCLYSDNEPRMINIKRLLEAYGYDDGIFYGTKDIGTAEDFITASLFTAMFAWDEDIVEEELPRNKEGIFRVCSMWLLKIAEQPENKEKYLTEIESIKKAAEFEHTYVTANKKYEFKPIHVTNEEILEYFKIAIKNEIDSIKIDDLTEEENNKIRKLLIAYCIQPNEETFKEIHMYIFSVKDNSKRVLLIQFVETLVPTIAKKIKADNN